MNIGFACLTIGVPGTKLKRCFKKNADHSTLSAAITQNLSALEAMIDYCVNQSISLFRISSDIIPFGSSPVNTVDWQNDFADDFKRIGRKISDNGIRVSMHPGQYTVINALDQTVVDRAYADLKYHADFLDCLNTTAECKIILHIGGVYKDKSAAMKRFVQQYHQLPHSVQRRLVIENDERLFTVSDALQIHQMIQIPVVFDLLHHALNQPETLTAMDWLHKCRTTWSAADGHQKIHYSQQAVGKRPGSHTQTIQLNAFLKDAKLWPDAIDVMLEVKDKNLSAVKCINALRTDRTITHLEKEWVRYKYEVLEQAPDLYLAIRHLLKEKKEYPVETFYQVIEAAAEKPLSVGHVVNAAQHVWGYLKSEATDSERRTFERQVTRYQNGELSHEALKKLLYRIAKKQNQPYLNQSLYLQRIC